jgi:hypothetical protein
LTRHADRGPAPGGNSHFVVPAEPSEVSFIFKTKGEVPRRVRGAFSEGSEIKSSEGSEIKANPEKGLDMRVHRTVLGLALSIGCGMAAPSAAFAQENRGTVEQQLACTPDVFRLCGEQIPDTNRIVACLRQNTPQLSRPCRAVFESNASMPEQAAPRVRAARPPLNTMQPPTNENPPNDSNDNY